MALAIGFLLLTLGVVTYCAWLPATFYFLQGLTTFSLLFWGLLAFLLGYSERKAKREFERAVNDQLPATGITDGGVVDKNSDA